MVQIEEKKLESLDSRVVKIRNTSEALLRPQYNPLLGPMGLGEYVDPHTASSVFLILFCIFAL